MRKVARTLSVKVRVALLVTAATGVVFLGATAAQAHQDVTAAHVGTTTVTVTGKNEAPWG